MAKPGVPGGPDHRIHLPCGKSVSARDLDLGTREFECACGETHAVVMDTDPLTRFVPEFLADALQEAIETEHAHREFSTTHLLGLVAEEHPDAIVTADVSDDGQVGYAIIWVAGFDARTLHAVVVDRVVDLMQQAIEQADDEAAVAEFEAYLASFEVEAFVEEYRATRGIEGDRESSV